MVQRRARHPEATAEQTEGRFTAYELRIPKGFAALLHSHTNEDEFFLVLSGQVRLQHGDQLVEGVPGSLGYTPRGVGHSFRVDSEEARLLLFFGPAGVEGFFREVATPARWFGQPPADEPRKDRDARPDHGWSRPDGARPTARPERVASLSR